MSARPTSRAHWRSSLQERLPGLVPPRLPLLPGPRHARADGSYARLLARLARIDVLVIDDWALSPALDADRHDLLEVIEDRYASRSTIITSQLPPTKWHEYLGDPTVADAILDRVMHNAHRLVLKGPSRRKEKDHTSAAA